MILTAGMSAQYSMENKGDNGSDGRRREQVSLEDRATSFYGDTAG